MEKIIVESENIVSRNVEKIGALFPNCITETRGEDGKLKKAINFETLQQMLSEDVIEGDESYEFTWVGKKASIAEANRPIQKTLRPCPEESVNWDTTENLYIEGDNLQVLKLLQKSYLGKVKMIYIDPPYNTGNDFVYNDDFAWSLDEWDAKSGRTDDEGNHLFKNTESNGRFHSDWCSMMYSRLLIAHTLLREDGVIFINMDENEITNLQSICLDIFGEENDLGTIVWDKRNPKGDAHGISYQHEYILVYAKKKPNLISTCKIQRPKKNASLILKKAEQIFSKISSSYSIEDANIDFATWMKTQTDFSGGEKAYNKIDDNGDVYRPVSMAWPNKKVAPDDYFVPLIHPVTNKPCPVPERGWRYPSKTMQRMLEEGLILFGKDETTIPNSKYLLRENLSENIPSVLYYGGSDTDLLTKMGIPFDTPKVVSICKEHICAFTKEEDIVIDFFSGSATTAHAVMQLNAEDGGNRKFIMVQIPEATDEKSEAYKAGYSNICEIGKERIRRAGKKINPLGRADLDVGFRVLKLDDWNKKDVEKTPAETSQADLLAFTDNLRDDRSDLDLLFGCLIESGLELTKPITSEDIEGCAVYSYNEDWLIGCFAENVPNSVIRQIAARKPRKAIFRDSSFADSPAKINVTEVFKMISPDTQLRVI